MAAIPQSDLPGHRQLHERVMTALSRCQESADIEFKGSQEWDTLKHHIARTCMAMANLRDGGVIVIGISENSDSWELTGMDDGHLATFAPDDIIDYVNRYASPPVTLDVVLVSQDNLRYLAAHVHEFENTPIVCKRNSTENGRYFSQGQILIRPAGKPQTKPVSNAAELHDLLDLAAEKRARRIIETSRRVGLEPSEAALDQFDEELEGL